MERVILHSDLNNFYASVEVIQNPDLKEKPIAVGGSIEHRHGIILAKNYIAKAFGVATGSAIWQARQICPNLIIIPPNYKSYIRFSREARRIYSYYTDLIEAFGIDECWLDVTGSTKLFGSGEKIANEIRNRIRTELGITASIGVSYNKIFSKLGSDMKKPDATTVITSENYKEKVWSLPVSDLLYVGRSTTKKMHKIAVYTIGELANLNPGFLKKILGKWGEYLWFFANGLDSSPVAKSDNQCIVKGIGNSMTTPRDLVNDEDVKILLYVLSESVSERLRNHYFKGKTIQIHVRDNQLFSIDRQAKLARCSFITGEIVEKAFEIFKNNWDWKYPIRSIGIRATDLVTADTYTQLSLFEDENKRIKKESLEHSIDNIRRRFGHYTIQRALLLKDKKLNANPIEENIIFPVSYFK
jgi:DNA polymerase-4